MSYKNILGVQVTNSLKGFVLPIVLLLVWWYLTVNELVNINFWVPPAAVIEAARAMLDEGVLWDNLSASLLRLAGGFACGAAAGLVLGLLLGLSCWADRLITPSFSAFRQISVFAWIPLISLSFGLGEPAKIFFVALVAFLPSVINTYEGIKSVPLNFIEVGRVYQFNPGLTLRRIILPAAAPSILMGLELSAIYAWLATIGSEYLMTGNGGIGAMMSAAQQNFMMDQIFVGIFVSGVVGFSVTAGLDGFRRHILRWQKSH